MNTQVKLTDEEKKALDIFKRIIKNRNVTSNDGVQCIQPHYVSMDQYMWLWKEGWTMAYDEYVTKGLTIPNNTICKHGIPVWSICVQREERKRGGCYRRIMPLITKIPIDK